MGNGINKGNLDKMYSIPVTLNMLKEIKSQGIKPEHIRQFIKNYGKDAGGMPKIRSDDWRRLRDILIQNPALQLIGQINSGKSHLVKKLIENDKSRVYIMLDSHGEYDLPVVHQITHDLKESVKLSLPKEPVGIVAMFGMYKDLILRDRFPAHYVLVVEEAMKYEKKGLKVLVAECRKFIKPLIVNQSRLYDFCPAIQTVPYHQFKY